MFGVGVGGLALGSEHLKSCIIQLMRLEQSHHRTRSHVAHMPVRARQKLLDRRSDRTDITRGWSRLPQNLESWKDTLGAVKVEGVAALGAVLQRLLNGTCRIKET